MSEEALPPHVISHQRASLRQRDLQTGLLTQLRKLLSYNLSGQLGTNKQFVIVVVVVVHLWKKKIQNQVFSRIVPLSGVVNKSGQIHLTSSVSRQTPRGSIQPSSPKLAWLYPFTMIQIRERNESFKMTVKVSLWST